MRTTLTPVQAAIVVELRTTLLLPTDELLTDNGSQFTDRFTSKKKDLDGNRIQHALKDLTPIQALKEWHQKKSLNYS